ncbi:hypothetical protein [Sphaerisporangium fuscum]|uniref:hypothetical protein n=1 Tax=Sphaerisporangium fuscum TaxID=2835868 RepID=UPI0020299CC1|nr:hypothetical protein [Sphaerisporangium fuscum]
MVEQDSERIVGVTGLYDKSSPLLWPDETERSEGSLFWPPPSPIRPTANTGLAASWPGGPSGRRAPASGDVCPVTGRGRLSYPRAEYLFKTASAELDPHRQGWTLHQLRHSALQHLAQPGRTAPELQAKSRHQHLASLDRYVRLGEETSARITAKADPIQRRRPR